MLEDVVIKGTVVFMIVFMAWKMIAVIFGHSHRRKWVRVVDIVALSIMAGSCSFVHFAWRRLYRPRYGYWTLIFAVIYIVFLVLCSFAAHKTDVARARAAKERDCPTRVLK